VSRFLNSGRFGYAMGYATADKARDAFDGMCADGEMSPCEGRVEPYQVRKDGKSLTRYAVTVAP